MRRVYKSLRLEESQIVNEATVTTFVFAMASSAGTSWQYAWNGSAPAPEHIENLEKSSNDLSSFLSHAEIVTEQDTGTLDRNLRSLAPFDGYTPFDENLTVQHLKEWAEALKEAVYTASSRDVTKSKRMSGDSRNARYWTDTYLREAHRHEQFYHHWSSPTYSNPEKANESRAIKQHKPIKRPLFSVSRT